MVHMFLIPLLRLLRLNWQDYNEFKLSGQTLVLKNSFPVAWRIILTFMIQVLSGNYSSTEQVNSIQQLITYSLITRTKVDIGEIIYNDLITKLLNNTSFSKDLFKVIEIELTAHIIAVNNQKDSVFLVPLSIKKKKGKTQTVTLTLPKSYGPEASGSLSKKRKQPKPQKTPSETKVSSPKPTEDFEQSHSVSSGIPTDKGLPSTASNEGMDKTTPCPEGPLGDKDLRGNKPPADMEPINPTIADPSGTCAKYQVDHTQFTKLRYQSLTRNEALLLSDDERVQESDEEEVFEAGEDMDEDTQANIEVQSPPPNVDKLDIDKFLRKDRPEFSSTSLMKHSGRNIKRLLSFMLTSRLPLKGDILNALNGATEALKAIQDAVKEGHREGKAIVTDDQPEDQRKLVPASKEVRPDLDAPILVPYEINGKNFQLTNEQIQAPLDKEEKIKKAAEEAKMFEMTKTEVIKVVPEEAKKIGLYPKKIISAKAGEKFKKAQDAEHQVLKREHSQKAKRAIELRMKSLLKMNDIHKFGVYSLVSYLVMASMVKNQENSMFGLKLRKLIAEHPDQEKLQSKKVKLEALGYKLD
ncbi:hypothetical protein Tco_0824059 [Tanacetum coccineum]|uniref:Uncharacterized protein n=1 Tax=Tanacetum coccineum TaxID=301880 RepID=A0ABQ5AJP1_9ASTR